jgi:DNA-binding NarL/FixJ family response regulator
MLVVVADDQDDMLLFVRRWFEREYRHDKAMRIETCNDLDKLEDFVDRHVGAKGPFLLMIDLNWHGDKIQTLKTIGRIKRSRAKRCWPILVYSESDDDKDVHDAHYHLANGYVHKGSDQEGIFIQTVNHWRELQLLPQPQ